MAIDDKAVWLENAMRRYENNLTRVAFAYLGDAALAEDAVQETFLKAWKGYDRFRGDANENTWLTRILINTIKDVRRSAWFKHIDISVSLDKLPEGSATFTLRDDAITRAVMSLPRKLRIVLLLRVCQCLTAEETARVLGVSRSTVFSRMQKSRAMLQNQLKEWQYESD